MNPVLHRTAQPIAALEFYDALRAAAPPRFPGARCIWPQRVGLAVSGGVDSMALAYLCAELRRVNSFMRVSDAPISGFMAMVIDHGLREGSDTEAEAVAEAVRKMGHRTQVWPLRSKAATAAPASIASPPWSLPSSSPTDAASSPQPGRTTGGGGARGIETNARRLRYRMLGLRLSQVKIVSCLLAHHEDDQYETVLMRLLSGYGLHGGIRGLRGMRPAADIPECHGMYGVHQSGLLDDLLVPRPYLLRHPSRRESRIIKSALRSDIDPAVLADEMESGAFGELDLVGPASAPPEHHRMAAAPPLAPLDTEDLGIMVYRPLLPFPKDRLVATCEAHGVPWFEDPTNQDPALTLRNALRHLARHHTLPNALQKPAVLRLAARCDATARRHEAEARRLVARHRIVVRFTANVGTVVARLPRVRPRARPRPVFAPAAHSAYAAASLRKRRAHLRTVAALVVQNLLALVTPETNVTPITQLQNVVDTLFPDLVPPLKRAPTGEPKAFSICGVHFIPLIGKKQNVSVPRPSFSSWYLSRAPHISPERANASAGNAPGIPCLQFPALSLSYRWDRPPSQWPWSGWSKWQLYDGRFWVRLRTRLPVVAQLQPFDKEHSKPLREALAVGYNGIGIGGGGGPPPQFLSRETLPHRSPNLPSAARANTNTAEALAATLKKHAPGKVRYTLPALYTIGDIEFALRGGGYWPEDHYPDANSTKHRNGDGDAALPASPPPPPSSPPTTLDRFLWERALRQREQAAWPDPERPLLRLVALPTLGLHVPGIEHWLQWEVRYRKVDTALLESSEEAPFGWA